MHPMQINKARYETKRNVAFPVRSGAQWTWEPSCNSAELWDGFSLSSWALENQLLLWGEMDVSNNSGTSKSSHFNRLFKRLFHYKPLILGFHYFWKDPNGVIIQPLNKWPKIHGKHMGRWWWPKKRRDEVLGIYIYIPASSSLKSKGYSHSKDLPH